MNRISDSRIEDDEGDDDRPDFFPALLRRQGAFTASSMPEAKLRDVNVRCLVPGGFGFELPAARFVFAAACFPAFPGWRRT